MLELELKLEYCSPNTRVYPQWTRPRENAKLDEDRDKAGRSQKAQLNSCHPASYLQPLLKEEEGRSAFRTVRWLIEL
jgi:hypothetical protein